MRSASWGFLPWLLVACGPHETEFVPEYADRWCDLVLACEDPAVLTFDGVTTHDACLSIYGPRIDAVGDGACKYKPKQAKRCLRAMELASCPADGAPVEDAVPFVCDEVYVGCEGALDNNDTGS